MNHAQRLRREIEEAIITGQFPPGTRLDEVSLAERYGVSRTPIREALLQLGAAGLIDVRPRRGAVVSAPDPQRLLEMFETMAELESSCGRLAARRLTPDHQERIEQAHRSCTWAAEHGTSEDYYEENRAFHNAIYAASRNSFLAEQALQLQRRLAPYRRLQLRVRNRVKQSLREHQGIVEAIVAGNEDLVAQRLREHVVIQGERFSDLMLSLGARDVA